MAAANRKRRWLLALALLVLAIGLGGWWIDRQLEPNRLTALVLAKAGKTFGLRLDFHGLPSYALKPEPRLLVPNFSAAGPDGRIFLSAVRAEISLPWSTLTGHAPVITRVELDRPALDLPGLRKWLDSRPKVPFEMPTLSSGLQIRDGVVHDDAYSITALQLNLPHLKSGDPLDLTGSGSYHRGQTVLGFNASLALDKVAASTDFKARVEGVLQRAPSPLKFATQANGHYLDTQAGMDLTLYSLAVNGDPPVPALRAGGRLHYGEGLQFHLDTVLESWPASWPALPQPLAASAGGLPITVGYAGKSDLSDPLRLDFIRGATQLHAAVRAPAMQAWLAADSESPLPPLTGTLVTPELVSGGTTMKGIQVSITDDDPATPPAR